jgi:hypothetical protein
MPILDLKLHTDDLPELLRAPFRECATLPLPKVAKLLGMHPQTLRAMLKTGKFSYQHKGIDGYRRHKRFTLDDVARMWHTMLVSPVVGPDGACDDEKIVPLR